MRVLQASRDALVAGRVELDALRGYLEGRDQAVIDVIESRLVLAARQDAVEALQADVEDLTAQVATLAGEQAGLKRTASVKLEAVSGSLEAVEWRTQETLTALNERMASLESGFAALAEAFESRQKEIAAAILTAIEPVGRIMHLVEERFARAAADLGEAQGALFGLLLERDDRLETQRDEALAQLLGEFAGTLKPKDRRRAGDALLEADEQRKKRRDISRSQAPPSPASARPGLQASSPGSGPPLRLPGADPKLASPFSPGPAQRASSPVPAPQAGAGIQASAGLGGARKAPQAGPAGPDPGPSAWPGPDELDRPRRRRRPSGP